MVNPLPIKSETNIPQNQESASFSVLNRAKGFGKALVFEAMEGVFFEYINIKVFRNSPYAQLVKVFDPVPCGLSGVISAAVVETVSIVYDVSLYILGDRQKYENLSALEGISLADRFRQKSWKVIGRFEKIQSDVDAVFSNFFGIRTEKEIKARFSNRKVYHKEGNPRFMEIFRKVFLDQVGMTVKRGIPRSIGIYTVVSLGYNMAVAQVFFKLQVIGFFSGLLTGINLERFAENVPEPTKPPQQ